MIKYKVFFISITLWVISLPRVSYSQINEEKESASKSRFYPLPVFYYLPSSGYSFGAAFIYYDKSKGTNNEQFPNVIGGYCSYSTKKLIQSGLKINRYFSKNKYKLDIEGNYFRTPDIFWSINPNTNLKESEYVTYDQYRIKADFLVTLNDKIYLGPFLWYEKFVLADYNPNGLIVNGGLLGSLGITNVGAGMEINYDGRDSLFFPTKGIYTDMKGTFFLESLYSDVNFFRMDFDFRYYFNFRQNQVLAFHTLFNCTVGDVPIQMLPRLGSQQMMRGYPTGKYYDKNLLAFQAEYRFPIIWRFSASVFEAVGLVFPKFSKIKVNELKNAGGVGLRCKVDKDQHINIRFDVANSCEGTFVYFTFLEAF